MITMTISSIVFWVIMLITYIYAVYDRKKSSYIINDYKSDKYGKLCVIFNLIGGFIVFEIFSFAIACFCKLITLNIIIHIYSL